MYVVVLVIFLAGFLLISIASSIRLLGEVLKAIRENETRAISLGYKTDRYKLLAFVLSAALAIASLWAAIGQAQPERARPNVVLIITDDMGWSDLGS